MTTPNIKALAEKVIRDSENPFSTRIARGYGPMFTEREMKLAFALLRVMEDADNLAKEVKSNLKSVNKYAKAFGIQKRAKSKALESHNKLMSELNENP